MAIGACAGAADMRVGKNGLRTEVGVLYPNMFALRDYLFTRSLYLLLPVQFLTQS